MKITIFDLIFTSMMFCLVLLAPRMWIFIVPLWVGATLFTPHEKKPEPSKKEKVE